MKAFKTKIDKVLEKKVSRKKFLQLLGIGAVTIPLLSPSVAASYFIRQSDGNLIDINDLPSDGGVGGTGSSNELAVWSGNKEITGNSGLTWDGSELDVDGDISVSGNAIVDERIGIGLTNPSRALEIASGGNLRLSAEDSEYNSLEFTGVGAGGGRFNIGKRSASNNSDLSITYGTGTANDGGLRLKQTGELGVGINPTQKLDVDGKIRMRDETEVSDGDDIVATKKYVDDEIDTAIAGTTDGTVTEIDTGTGLTGGPITDTGTISIDTTWAAQFNSVSIGINEVISSTRALTVTSASITGELDMNTNRITNLAEPTSAADAATKDYVDAAAGTGFGGSGTENYIPVWTGSEALGDSSIYYDEGDIGLGTTEPHEKLDVDGNIRIREENSIKYGGTGSDDAKFEIKYNADTESLDFNFLE